jgi:hypothetical protein
VIPCSVTVSLQYQIIQKTGCQPNRFQSGAKLTEFGKRLKYTRNSEPMRILTTLRQLSYKALTTTGTVNLLLNEHRAE